MPPEQRRQSLRKLREAHGTRGRHRVAVRNSWHPAGSALIYTRGEIPAFLAGAKKGEFNDLSPMMTG
jgi:hypothetical protein